MNIICKDCGVLVSLAHMSLANSCQNGSSESKTLRSFIRSVLIISLCTVAVLAFFCLHSNDGGTKLQKGKQ